MTSIDWSCPKPRSGLAGALDRFIGPGATRAELLLQSIIPLAAVVFLLGYAGHANLNWTVLQQSVAAMLAFDVAGGVVTNATSSAKRWFHRPGQRRRDHLGFISLHLSHLAIVSWLFMSGDANWFVMASGLLLVTSLVVILTPVYLKRPVAHFAFACSLLVVQYAMQSPQGLEWFLPLFYLKLLLSHLPPEAPFRPDRHAVEKISLHHV